MTKKQLIGNYNYKEGTIKIKDELIYLTETDNKIFKILLDNYNKIITPEKICKKAYNSEIDELYHATIRTAISRLRKKIKDFANIYCKQRFGYRLEMKRVNKKWK